MASIEIRITKKQCCKRDGLIVYAVSGSVPAISDLTALLYAVRAQSLREVVDVPAVETSFPGRGRDLRGNVSLPAIWGASESADDFSAPFICPSVTDIGIGESHDCGEKELRILLCALIFVGGLALACSLSSQEMRGTIQKQSFGKTVGGEGIDLYSLANKKGMEVSITNFGATVVALRVPDRGRQGRGCGSRLRHAAWL